MVRIKVGEELKKQNRMRGFHWLMSKTRHITEPCHRASSHPLGPSLSTAALIGISVFVTALANKLC